jgi:transposase
MGGSRVQGACPRPESVQFVLSYKRLERGRFRLPVVTPGATSLALDATELAMLLDGIDFGRVKRPVPWTPPRTALAASSP